ncbi:hypothetical protein H6784_01515 [Candidatus Nomurabacteria bacterium]|nr:hypothetical protein [Candidatus Nomurabacteria bacterium]
MSIFLAILLYLIITVSVLHNWIILTLLAGLVFSLRYQSYALVPLAIIIDGYYGAFYTFPVLSVIAIAWYLFIEFFKPKLTTTRD